MKPLSERNPFRVGVGLIVVLAVLGLGLVGLTKVTFGKRTYTAMLAQTAGLRPGEAVDVHGVVVGTVKSTDLDGTAVKVTFTLDKSIRIGDRTTAAVEVATLLGTHYLAIDPQGSGTISQIPLERTSVPYNLQDVINGGTTKLRQLDTTALSKALASVADVLGKSKNDIEPALSGVAALSKVISDRSGQLDELLAAAQSVAQELRSDSGDIVGLERQADLVITELTSRQAQIRALLTGATSLARSVSGVIGRTQAHLGPALTSLDTVVRSLTAQKKEIAHVLGMIGPAARYVSNALGNGSWLDINSKGGLLPSDDQKCALGDC